jgi:hypothetical protein
MNAATLVGRWRVRLGVIAVLLAALHALGAAGVATRVAFWLGGSLGQAAWLGALVGLGTATWRGYRAGLGRLTRERIALWLEERAPELQYALLGALAGSVAAEAAVQRVPVARAAWRGLRGPVLRAIGVGAVGAGALAWAPASANRLVTRSLPMEAGAVAGVGRIRVRVIPPTYTRRAIADFVSPDVVQPIAGSRVEVTGEGASPVVVMGQAPLVARDTGRGWLVVVVVDTVAGMLRFERNGASRLLVIDPVRDALPLAVVESPKRDTVVRTAPTSLELTARFTDDLGLQRTHFEYIVTSGSGERFTFRSGEVSPRAEGTTVAARTATWSVASLGLQAGDVVHVRAVARDSRGQVGTSETRSLRILRPRDDDSVAVDAAPPPEMEAPLLSQRMLINLTEALVRRERALASSNVLAEATRIGRDQARLRRQVSDLVFERLGDDPSGEHFHGDGHEHGAEATVRRPLTPEELVQAADRATGARGSQSAATHDESPVLSVSRPLLEAYNAMWEAGRLLESGSPRAALPPMYVALAAIQKARAAERLYLRGAQRSVVVDLSKVRLAGRERGTDRVIRGVPVVLPAKVQRVWERIVGAMAGGDAGSAVDSLLVLRVESVGEPQVAAALDSLVAGIRRSQDVTRVLLALRERLGGSSVPGPVTQWRRVP